MTELPLGVPDLDAYRTPEANDLNSVEGALAAVRSRCGWHIAPVITETLRLRVVGDTVILPTLRALEASVTTEDGSTVDPDEYELHPGFIRFSSNRGCEARVTVELTHGYENVPADLRQAIMADAHAGTFTDGRLAAAGPFRYEFSSQDAGVVSRYALAPRP